jgi:head-tail adaptor
MNTNTEITLQLMRTARTLEAEWVQVLRGRVSTGTKEDESSTGRVWAAGFHHVTASSRLARVSKLMNVYLFNFQFFSGRGKPRILKQ